MLHLRSRSLIGAAFVAGLSFTLSVQAGEDDVALDAALGDDGRAPTTTEEVTVVARGTAADVPSALATDQIHWQDAVGAPADFQDLVTRVPGIGATGQNGLFETFSIRGSGGNGILILVGGMPVTAQRRAGVPVAFVEPSLLGAINVTRGPATVHFGPGALGGASAVEPRWFDGTTVSAGYASSGDEVTVMGGFGNETFSIAAARRRAGDSESANGTPLNTSFERNSATLQYRRQLGAIEIDALLMPSTTDDIGKSNSRFPARDTTYPEDDHVVGRLRLRHDNGLEASIHGHDQSLLTYNRRPGTPDSFAYVESLDVGATLQQTIEHGAVSYNVGIEYLGRRDVNGFDARGTLDARTYSLRDASEDVWSLFGLADWQVSERVALEAGARVGGNRQQQAGADSDDSDTAFTAAAIWAPDGDQRWSLNVASGYRFATLEERFFTGVTAQGEILGNPDLGTERSLGVDLGYTRRSGDWQTQLHLWRTDVDDLIQLFEVAPGVNGYTNVGEAALHGFEASLSWTPTTELTLHASGAVVRSKDQLTGDPLYGAPPVSASLQATYAFSRMTLGGHYSHRWRMKRPGFEEVERDSVDLVDLDLTFHASPTLDLQLFVRNAFDEDYFATADELSSFGQERSIGLNLVWSMH